jgi:hypothetical protein
MSKHNDTSRAEDHPCYKCPNSKICEEGFACEAFYKSLTRNPGNPKYIPKKRGVYKKKPEREPEREPTLGYYLRAFKDERKQLQTELF